MCWPGRALTDTCCTYSDVELRPAAWCRACALLHPLRAAQTGLPDELHATAAVVSSRRGACAGSTSYVTAFLKETTASETTAGCCCRCMAPSCPPRRRRGMAPSAPSSAGRPAVRARTTCWSAALRTSWGGRAGSGRARTSWRRCCTAGGRQRGRGGEGAMCAVVQVLALCAAGPAAARCPLRRPGPHGRPAWLHCRGCPPALLLACAPMHCMQVAAPNTPCQQTPSCGLNPPRAACCPQEGDV